MEARFSRNIPTLTPEEQEVMDNLQKEQQQLCEQDKPTEILSFEEAKKRKLDLF